MYSFDASKVFEKQSDFDGDRTPTDIKILLPPIR